MHKLKVWVIEGVLTDYSDGMVVVAAYSKKQALEQETLI